MKALLQRVTSAAVAVDGVELSRIERGFLILLGVRKGDDEEDARVLAEKIAKFRVFSDENGKMNKSVKDIGGSLLVVSQLPCVPIMRTATVLISLMPKHPSVQTRFMSISFRCFAHRTFPSEQVPSARTCRSRSSMTVLLPS